MASLSAALVVLRRRLAEMRCIDPIRPGERYQLHGKNYQVMEVDGDQVQLRSVYGPVQVLHLYDVDLRRAAAQGKFLKTQEAPITTDPSKIVARLRKKDAERFEIRVAYVQAVLSTGWVTRKNFPDLIEAMVDKLGPHKAPSYTTLWQWKRTYLCSGRNSIALIPKTFRPINKHISHQPYEVQQVIRTNIASYYWNETPFSKTWLIASIRLMVEYLNRSRAANEQFRIPSKSTVYRIICEVDSYQTTVHQKGIKAAKKLHYWGEPLPEPERLFELVEADTRPMDIVLVDEKGKPIGKPVLTVFIEVKTRYIIAWHISFNPASLDTTEIALKQSMSANNPHGGVAERYVFDNGGEWIANVLRKILYLIGSDVTYCEVEEPNQKPHVEAFFKTWAQEIEHRLRGTTKQNPEARGKYDAWGNAIYTLEKAKAIMGEFLDVYHSTVHSTLEMSPNEAWSNELAQQFPPRRYSDEDLRRYFWRAVEVTPHRSGRVRYNNLHWWGGAISYLAELQPKVEKILLYVDPCDVGNAWVCHPLHPEEIQPVHPLHPGYQNGLTLHFHQEIWKARQLARKARSNTSTEETMVHLLWKIAQTNSKGRPSKFSQTLEHDDINLAQIAFDSFSASGVARPRMTDPEYNPNTPEDFTIIKGNH
jgi:putative transposase